MDKDLAAKLKKQIDILVSEETLEPEILEAHKKIFARLAKEFVGVQEEKKGLTPTYAAAASKPIDPYDYAVTENVAMTHMINYHAGMYHWMSDIRTRSLIKLRQDFEIEVKTKMASGRVYAGFCTKDGIKWVQLSLLDVGIELPDGKGKFIATKIKLVKMIEPIKPVIDAEEEDEQGD